MIKMICIMNERKCIECDNQSSLKTNLCKKHRLTLRPCNNCY
jgi:hypothetical protein